MSNHIDLENMASMDDLLSQSTAAEIAEIKEDKLVTGRIAAKNENGVLLDIGFKSEAFINRAELGEKWETISIGDELEVYLERMDDEENFPSVSLRKAEIQKSWDSIVQNYNEGDVIKGTIKNRVKGGLIVDVGVEAFLPGSQVDLGQVRNLDDFLGIEDDFKILKINGERRNIVLSRRELLEAARAEQRAALLEELVPNTRRIGKVKNITEFGAFVDLNGMDGLLHITDMSWKRISHPSEVVQVDQEIEVMILDVDKARQRVSLGLKQLEGLSLIHI